MQESATYKCENYLRAQRLVFIEKEIWPSKVPVIDWLLLAKDEMCIVYHELVEKLAERHWKLVLDKILDESVMSAPDVTKDARLQRNELVIVNEQITSVANQLADLLHKRRELRESSGFSDGTCFHIVNLIDKAASQSNGHYRSFLQKPLRAYLNRVWVFHQPDFFTGMEALFHLTLSIEKQGKSLYSITY